MKTLLVLALLLTATCSANIVLYSGDSTGFCAPVACQVVAPVPVRDYPYWGLLPSPAVWISGYGNTGFGGQDGDLPVSTTTPLFTDTESFTLSSASVLTVSILGDDAYGLVDNHNTLVPLTSGFEPGDIHTETFTLSAGPHRLIFSDYNLTDWAPGSGNYSGLEYLATVTPSVPEPTTYLMLATGLFFLGLAKSFGWVGRKVA